MRTHTIRYVAATLAFAAALAARTTLSAATQSGAPVDQSSVDETADAQTRYATKGVVKSASRTRLVVARSARRGGELTFVLTVATIREGSPTAGSTVSVRYRVEDHKLVATAFTVQPKTQVPK